MSSLVGSFIPIFAYACMASVELTYAESSVAFNMSLLIGSVAIPRATRVFLTESMFLLFTAS